MNTKQPLKERTKLLALAIIQMSEQIPTTTAGRVIARQVMRSATSVGANYRAAARARSTADMIAKLKIVEEECDETLYWLELLVESKLVSQDKLRDLMQESNEILAMTVASIKTLRRKK